ncbi:unnamed protein product [Meloidogyne enterolobii]|uniref:Uncharacterized protein n=1 Tax=Meloidogyne enterolobii TaxID=390850 RepID=A0ACB0XYG2_MELEN
MERLFIYSFKYLRFSFKSAVLILSNRRHLNHLYFLKCFSSPSIKTNKTVIPSTVTFFFYSRLRIIASHIVEIYTKFCF